MIGQKTKLEFQKLTLTSDGMGGNVESHSTILHIKGVMESVLGKERFAGDTKTIFATHRFYCDYPHTTTVTLKDRFLKGSKVFEIIYIVNTAEQDRFLEITLKEVE